MQPQTAPDVKFTGWIQHRGTRYAVAVYLVVFGSIIVAAYKMGMVHEKPRIVTRNPLDADDVADQAASILRSM